MNVVPTYKISSSFHEYRAGPTNAYVDAFSSFAANGTATN